MDTQRDPQFHPEERRTALSLADFAQQNKITEERVWEMIEEGSIAARFVNDSILIMRDNEPTIEAAYELPEIGVREPLPAGERAPVVQSPSLPDAVEIDARKPLSGRASTPQSPSRADAIEIEGPSAAANRPIDEPHPDRGSPCGILDGALQSSDDSHDILLFAQDALARAEELSRQLLATKDELIRMKDEKIARLTEQIQQKDREIRFLNRQIEDYATLRNFEKS